jgi:two-component system, chemotaxis family, chemotaxis protein CheY
MKKTILVVDDFASIRDFVCEILQQKGYDTVGAANGTHAYQLLAGKPEVDLVLTDYNMPDCTGFELLKKIKDNPSTAKVPVVFLTTESNPDKMRAAKEAGLSGWIRKPYRAEMFFSQIENALNNG